MTDIVKSMKEAVCLPDTGCMSVVTCVCDIMQDAADEIEWLRYEIAEYDRVKDALQASHIELASALDQIEERRRIRSVGEK